MPTVDAVQTNPPKVEKKFMLLGNEAVALGLIDEGADYFTGYPGTPSTEIMEYALKKKEEEGIIAHWGTNEAAALEDAAAAAISGHYAVFTAKHVGLNVAADPFVSLATMGIRGGLVLCISDDPSMHSSQNEQDTRWYGRLAHVPIIEPTDPSNAYQWARKAMELSIETKLPVILRLTTRISHGLGTVERGEKNKRKPLPYERDVERFVSIPANARKNKLRHNEAFAHAKEVSDNAGFFKVLHGKDAEFGVIASGIAASYCEDLWETYQFNLAIPYVTHPLPKKQVLDFLQGKRRILIVEELDGVLETDIKKLAFEEKLPITIIGKDMIPMDYELKPNIIEQSLRELLGLPIEDKGYIELPMESLLPRPPSFCAGCPHRAAYYDLKRAFKNMETIYSNDIGCYSLGALPPYNEADSILCMGASIGMAVGYAKTNPDKKVIATIGDSTFWHSGIAALANAIWQEVDLLVVVLDNSTTAMTGTQENPSTHGKLNIAKTIQGMGIPAFELSAFEYKEFIDLARRLIKLPGVKAIVSKQPCVIYENHEMKKQNLKPKGYVEVDHEKCTLCGLCVEGLNCTALSLVDGKIEVDVAQCNGCEFCSTICPRDAFVLKEV